MASEQEKRAKIRKVVNSDQWMEMMTDEDLDKTLEALALPARRLIKRVFDTAKEILRR